MTGISVAHLTEVGLTFGGWIDVGYLERLRSSSDTAR
jgi:hypothetical protein